MNEVQSIGAADIRHSIARAAQATGVDFGYLLAQAKLESSLNPNAKAGTSSAVGLYQFINSTWLETLDRHGASHGLEWAADAIAGGRGGPRVSDPALRERIMALRYDPDAASLMAGELARDNRAALSASLGREPDHVELYLAHFMGRDGAIRFLGQLESQPGAIAARLFPAQAAANREVFYAPSGEARSVGEVMDVLRRRFEQALDDASGGLPAEPRYRTGPAAPRLAGPLGLEFAELAAAHNARGRRMSMQETLRETFGGTERQASAMPAAVRTAYSRLEAYRL